MRKNFYELIGVIQNDKFCQHKLCVKLLGVNIYKPRVPFVNCLQTFCGPFNHN